MPTERRLTLLVPGLLGPRGHDAARVVGEGLEVPALEWLLSRADRFAVGDPNALVEGLLFEVFGFERPPGADWPAGAVTYALDAGADPAAWCLRADPVHLQADLRDVTLFDAGAFSLDPAEAEALAAEVNACLAELGESWGESWGEPRELEVLHPMRWYLRLRDAAALRTHPPSQVIGAHLEEFMPEGADADRWRRLLNEIQMTLHASRVNEARQRRGERPVNSVWFWGGGKLPAPPTPRWEGVWSEHPLAEGLARLGGIPHRLRGAGAHEWLDQASPGRHLLVDERPHRFNRLADIGAWRQHLEAFERDWVAPLREALGRGAIDELSLLVGREYAYRVRRRDLRRFWRRRRRLIDLMVDA